MALIVQKYGGTSVGSIKKILAIAAKIKKAQIDNQLVIALSAMGGHTNRLIELASEISGEPSARELDVLLATGEQTSIALLSMALHKQGVKALSLLANQIKILTTNNYGKARIKSIDITSITTALSEGNVVVVAGFQGIDDRANITTLGRGGSDTTAVALAAALKADECQIYTDVDGVYTTDPRIEPKAKRINVISYEEMLEMASLGSKVLQIRSVEFADKYQVPLRVLSSMLEKPQGTLITNEDNMMEQVKIAGIAHQKDEAKLSLIGVPDKPGVAFTILDTIARQNIEVDMIVQSASAREGATNFAFTVHRSDFKKSKKILQQIKTKLGAVGIQASDNVVKISLVGIGMRSHAGIASKMFGALHKENINIDMISTSEIKISVLIDEKYLELAVRSLHNAFELDK